MWCGHIAIKRRRFLVLFGVCLLSCIFMTTACLVRALLGGCSCLETSDSCSNPCRIQDMFPCQIWCERGLGRGSECSRKGLWIYPFHVLEYSSRKVHSVGNPSRPSSTRLAINQVAEFLMRQQGTNQSTEIHACAFLPHLATCTFGRVEHRASRRPTSHTVCSIAPKNTLSSEHSQLRILVPSARHAPARHLQGYLAHKKPPSLGPYSRPMPRALWWSYGGGCFL